MAVAQARPDPLLRWLYFYEPRAYPNDTIPPRALQKALEQYQQQFPPSTAPAGAPAPLETAWTPLGPDHLVLGGASFSGRVTAIVVDPTDSNTIYVGAAQGGVWKTNDGGATWVPLTDTHCSLAMGSIAIDPVDPNIIYAGTGEQNFSIDSYYGCGVLRSTDRGTTWTQLGASVFDINTTSTGGAKISKVVVDPLTAGSTTSTTVHVASSLGVYRSLDSGTTWTQVLAGVATDLVLDPSNPAVLYAAIGSTGGGTANGIYKSTNGGASYSKLAGGFPTSGVGRISLAIAPSAPATLYASVHNPSTNGLLGVFKTINGGTSWVQVTAGAFCSTQCWYDMIVAVHPADPNTVYFGGVLLFKSTDGGNSLQNITGGIHVDQHALAFDHQNASVVYVGNDGGVFKSTNGGTNWSSLNTNLAITQFYPGVSLHPTDANYILGGTQDNGTLRFTGSSVWQEISLGGDGGYTAIDFVSPSTIYHEFQWDKTSFSGPRRSDDGGASFAQKNSGIDISDDAAFVPPYVMDPSNSQTLYFGTFKLYKTTNRGDSWTVLAGGADLTKGTGVISTIAVAPSNPQVIYVGASDGNVVVTTNGGSTFTTVISGLPNRFVKAIAVDPTSASTAYVAFSGFGSGHIFTTTNTEASWTNISANLPDVPVNAILLDPGAPSNIYIGTDLGVFRSTDGGGSWLALNTGLPNVAVFDLAFRSGTNVLVAATHGRGVFKIPVTGTPVLSVTPTSLDFGKVTTGSTADRTFTVQNIGQGTLSGSASTSTPFNVTTGGTYSLGAGASLGVVVRFAPGSGGVFSSAVTFTGASSLSRLVSGQGVNTVVLTVSKSGNGSGTVTSSVGGIDCGLTC